MKLESRFNIGDKVYLMRTNRKSVSITCPICNGNKDVLISNTKFPCPKCYRDGYLSTEYYENTYDINGPYTVGLVRVEARKEHNSKLEPVLKEEYMCFETGIGSGSVYGEIVKVFATKKEAEEAGRKEVERLNKLQGEQNE